MDTKTERNDSEQFGTAISLRIWHPTIPSRELTEIIEITPTIANDVGSPRRTPAGQILDGTYAQTYWTHRFNFPENAGVEHSIYEALVFVKSKSERLNKIQATGGRYELFVGLFLGANTGIELDAALIKSIAEVGLGLSFDIYTHSTASRGSQI
jgi:hypothetical protein